eukprot:131648_1
MESIFYTKYYFQGVFCKFSIGSIRLEPRGVAYYSLTIKSKSIDSINFQSIAWLNNMRYDEHVLGPFTQFERTTYYDMVNCTSMLHTNAPNVFGIAIGNGRYTILSNATR